MKKKPSKTPKRKAPVAAKPEKLPSEGCDKKEAIRAVIALLKQGWGHEEALGKYGLFWEDVRREFQRDKELNAAYEEAIALRQEWWEKLAHDHMWLMALGKVKEAEVTSRGTVVHIAKTAKDFMLRLFDQKHPKPKDTDADAAALTAFQAALKLHAEVMGKGKAET